MLERRWCCSENRSAAEQSSIKEFDSVECEIVVSIGQGGGRVQIQNESASLSSTRL